MYRFSHGMRVFFMVKYRCPTCRSPVYVYGADFLLSETVEHRTGGELCRNTKKLLVRGITRYDGGVYDG